MDTIICYTNGTWAGTDRKNISDEMGRMREPMKSEYNFDEEEMYIYRANTDDGDGDGDTSDENSIKFIQNGVVIVRSERNDFNIIIYS